MTTIIGISGSLRRGSYNSALLAAAKELMPAGTTLEIASIRDIPLYDGDWEEEHGLPESVRELKERIASSNGVLIATPEYNNSIPGVAKNAIDWLTRPPADIRRVFGGLPIALMGATPGRGATTLSQAAWLPIPPPPRYPPLVRAPAGHSRRGGALRRQRLARRGDAHAPPQVHPRIRRVCGEQSALRRRFPMKSSSLILMFSILLLPACQKSEISDKPAAEVSDTAAATSAAATDTSSTAPTPGATTANVIKEKSKIEFVGAKVTRDHQGKFHNFDGWIEYAGGKPTKVSFDIDLNSIETDTEQLTQHLKTPDFFDVAKYPKATFASTSLTDAPAGSPAGTTHMLNGNLTMHGVTKAVSIPVKAQQSPEGVRTTSEFTINRHDWGISYKGMADDLIKDNVLIKLDLMFPPPPAA